MKRFKPATRSDYRQHPSGSIKANPVTVWPCAFSDRSNKGSLNKYIGSNLVIHWIGEVELVPVFVEVELAC